MKEEITHLYIGKRGLAAVIDYTLTWAFTNWV
jgi:hypothetical protein